MLRNQMVKRAASLTIAAAVMVSGFSFMGMDADAASAATKRPAKVTAMKVTGANQSVTVSWKKAKKIKVNGKKYKVKYQLKSVQNTIFGKKVTKKQNLSGSKKTFVNHPGTKYTFQTRAFYSYKGKKVYGKWSAKKVKTVPTDNLSLSVSRHPNTGIVRAKAVATGTCNQQGYSQFVYTFNGQVQTVKSGSSAQFKDANAGTVKAYAVYKANGYGKTVAVKSKIVSKSVSKAPNGVVDDGNSNNGNNPGTTDQPTGNKPESQDPVNENYEGDTEMANGETGASTPEMGNAKTPYVASNFSEIGPELAKYGGNTSFQPNGKDKNVFYVGFNKDIKSKYNWMAYPMSNSRLQKTLNISDQPRILDANFEGYAVGYNLGGSNQFAVMTNWACTDVYMAAFDKSTGRQVYGKKFGWTAMPGECQMAPGDVRINGPYYSRCEQVVSYIMQQSGCQNSDTFPKKTAKIEGAVKKVS